MFKTCHSELNGDFFFKLKCLMYYFICKYYFPLYDGLDKGVHVNFFITSDFSMLGRESL